MIDIHGSKIFGAQIPDFTKPRFFVRHLWLGGSIIIADIYYLKFPAVNPGKGIVIKADKPGTSNVTALIPRSLDFPFGTRGLEDRHYRICYLPHFPHSIRERVLL